MQQAKPNLALKESREPRPHMKNRIQPLLSC